MTRAPDGEARGLHRMRFWLRRGGRVLRLARTGTRAIADPYRPLMAHLIAMRRCNLSCAYCNEYDATSQPVHSDIVRSRIDRLSDLGLAVLTFSGGEPLLHPELPSLVAHGRARGLFVTLITNGYLLSREAIAALNRAGLDHLQISIDNVEPDAVSMKSL